MNDIGFQDAKAFLQKSCDTEGSNLYDHACEVFQRIFEERPGNVMEMFEQLSSRTKQTKFTDRMGPQGIKDTLSRGVVWAENCNKAMEPAAGKKIAKGKGKGKKQDNSSENSGSEESESEEEGNAAENVAAGGAAIPDLITHASHMENAGVAVLSSSDNFRLLISIKHLAARERDINSIRLFGKILGTKADYIIIETEMAVAEEGSDNADAFSAEDAASGEPPAEPRGVGVNKYTYWVCSYAGGNWTRLPDATPAQLRVSREITKFFTGNLDTSINSYPPFPGMEAHYLRAQIARIAHSTSICPREYYVLKGDKDGEEPDEENPADTENENDEIPKTVQRNDNFRAQSIRQQTRLENWVHYYSHILPQGRTTFWKPKRAEKKQVEEGEEGEDGTEADAQTQEAQSNAEGSDNAEEIVEEVPAPPLQAVNEDALAAGLPAFIARKTSNLSPHPIVSFRSVRWPGAYAFAFDNSFCNVYIGWGQKFSGDSYTPPAPQVMCKEPHTMRERFDPSTQQEEDLEEKRNPKKPEPAAGEAAGENGSTRGSREGSDDPDAEGGSGAEGEGEEWDGEDA